MKEEVERKGWGGMGCARVEVGGGALERWLVGYSSGSGYVLEGYVSEKVSYLTYRDVGRALSSRWVRRAIGVWVEYNLVCYWVL